MEKFHRSGIATVLTTYTQFNVLAHSAAFLYGHLNQQPYPLLIDRLEGIAFVNAPFQVIRQEFARIVTREAECQLRQVVGTKREKFGLFSNTIRNQRGTRCFDHCTNQELNPFTTFGKNRFGGTADHLSLGIKLTYGADQRNHDFSPNINTFGFHVERSFDNGPGLHFRDFRIGNPQPTPAVSHHWVEFV